jgi:tRNA A-37 threonylcarbamoyl transferase component Bud32
MKTIPRATKLVVIANGQYVYNTKVNNLLVRKYKKQRLLNKRILDFLKIRLYVKQKHYVIIRVEKKMLLILYMIEIDHNNKSRYLSSAKLTSIEKNLSHLSTIYDVHKFINIQSNKHTDVYVYKSYEIALKNVTKNVAKNDDIYVYKIYINYINRKCEIDILDEINKCTDMDNNIIKYFEKIICGADIIYKYVYYEIIPLQQYYLQIKKTKKLNYNKILLSNIFKILQIISRLHKNYIYHLDLYEGNIVIAQVDGEYKILLLDFGESHIINIDHNTYGLNYDIQCFPKHIAAYNKSYRNNYDEFIRYITSYENNEINILSYKNSALIGGDVSPEFYSGELNMIISQYTKEKTSKHNMLINICNYFDKIDCFSIGTYICSHLAYASEYATITNDIKLKIIKIIKLLTAFDNTKRHTVDYILFNFF